MSSEVPGRVPTVQMSLLATTATPYRTPGWLSGTTLQLLPSQCSVSVWSLGAGYNMPTAQTSLLAPPTATTPHSSLSAEPGLGLGTMFHCVPSQCSVRVNSGQLKQSL